MEAMGPNTLYANHTKVKELTNKLFESPTASSTYYKLFYRSTGPVSVVKDESMISRLR